VVFDHSTLGEAFSRPGMDTRQWISYGIVNDEVADGPHSTHFDDEDGAPLGVGPIIAVTLQPSNIVVACRVASGVAGNGEAEWFPFQAKDEVLVAIPEGDERAGCVIIGRLPNSFDVWPRTVAGQDATQGTFGFRRMRTPFIVETAASYLVRSATTGAQFGIDQTGQFILNDGDGSRFFFGADALGLSSADGTTSIQVLVADKQIAMTAGASTSLLLGADVSQFLSTGILLLGTSGAQPNGHAVTVEQMIVFVDALLKALCVAQPAAWVGATLAPLIPAALNAAIPVGAVGSIAPYLAALTAAISIPPDPTGQIPGLGRAGLLL
jgi:hypothetical protein